MSAEDPPGLGAHLLLPRHLADLAESGIDDAAARRHGFRSISQRQELIGLGFSAAQAKKLVQNLPALALPSWAPDGTIAGWQIKPDAPRHVGGKGHRRPVRYETPDGAANVLDFGPAADPAKLGDPRCPMFVVEGVKKAVKLRLELERAGKSAIVVGLLGVWGWRHTNARGGKSAHPLLVGGALALNGRLVVIAYDSDVWSHTAGAKASRGVPSSSARLAADKLASLLRAFKAVVKFVIFPPLEDSKQGIDDILTRGGTIETLENFLADEPPRQPKAEGEGAEAPTHPYCVTDGGTYLLKRTAEGVAVPIRLANFTARIERETVIDDGAERVAHYETWMRVNGRVIRDRVLASRFGALVWISSADAIITPGQACRDHLRAAVQHLSAPVEVVTAYAHTGWRRLEGTGWAYLHAAGAIGPTGPVLGVETRLSDLPHYRLPDPPADEALLEAVRASLGMLDVAPLRVSAPLLGATYRAAIGDTTAALFVAGKTGRRKSALAALAQQHYGPSMDAEHLPGNWTSTENTLEELGFRAQDAVLVIDDFCPAGSVVDYARHHARAARIFRATGNHSARGRMRADGSLRPSRPPRCLVIATGEDVPRGQSIRARMHIVEVEEGDVDLARLTQCQADAAAGLYAAAMAGFARWLAPRLEDVRARQTETYRALRDAVRACAAHARVPANVADLGCGLGWLLEFAVDVGAITIDDAEQKFADGLAALVQGARSTARYLTDTDAATRYLELLAAAITSGEAHLADSRTGHAPTDPAAHGWREAEGPGGWHTPAGSKRIGWVEGAETWIDPDAAYAVVCGLAQRQGEAFSVGPTAIAKRLHEAGRLLRVEAEKDGAIRYAVRETPKALGRRTRVLVLGPSTAWETGPIGPIGEEPAAALHFSWPGFAKTNAREDRATNPEIGPQPTARPGPKIREPWPDKTGPGNGAAEQRKTEETRGSGARGPIGPVPPEGETPEGDDEIEVELVGAGR